MSQQQTEDELVQDTIIFVSIVGAVGGLIFLINVIVGMIGGLAGIKRNKDPFYLGMGIAAIVTAWLFPPGGIILGSILLAKIAQEKKGKSR